MKCPNCSHENPDGNKFCAECGSKLGVVFSGIECPECHSLIPLDSKFCPDCGNKIEKNSEHTNLENPSESSSSFCCSEGHLSFEESHESDCGSMVEKHCEYADSETQSEPLGTYSCAKGYFYEESQENGSYIDKTEESSCLYDTKESLMINCPLGIDPKSSNVIGHLYSICSGVEDYDKYTDHSKCYRIKAANFDVSEFFGYPVETIQIHPEHRKIIYNIRLKRYFEDDKVPYSVKPFMDIISRKLCSIGIDIEEGPKTLLGGIWYSDVHSLEIQTKRIYPILWCDIIVKL